MHIATNRPGPGQDFALEDRNCVRNSFLANADHWVRMSLSDMIFSGVFERYPKLKVGTVEHELSLIPHFLDRIMPAVIGGNTNAPSIMIGEKAAEMIAIDHGVTLAEFVGERNA